MHQAALLNASLHTTEQSFRNIIKPMPRTCLSNDITQYMSYCQPSAELDADLDAAQPTKRARPGNRTRTGARQSEQRPAMLQLNIEIQKGRRKKRHNEHRREIVAPARKIGKVRATLPQIDAPILTRQERANRVYDQHAEQPDEKGATRALEKCTDTAHTITRIIGWRMVTNHKGNILKEKKVEGASQVQYLVDWAPTLEEAWAVRAYKDLGYRPTSVVPISFATLSDEPENHELYDQIACEICCSKDDDYDMILCDECDRGYHKGCLAHRQPTMGQLDTAWHCDHCERMRTTRNTRNRCPGDTKVQLLKVTWPPNWEPESHVPADLAASWKAEMQGQQVQHHREDVTCTELEKQGIHGQNTYVGHMFDTARHNVTIDHQPVDPYTDIAPVNAYALNFRPVVRTSATKHSVQHRHCLTACSTGLDGRCVGQICGPRLQVLWDRYNHVVSNDKDLADALGIRTFEEEVHHLLLRYKDGAVVRTGTTNRVVNMKNHWATPPAIMTCLQQHLHITTERFASPLNFNAQMHTYYSCHERDQAFGATWNAFSVKWTGISQCNPEYEHEDMEKAVRWALNSARSTTIATLTLCILPAWDGNSNTAYNRMIVDHPDQCHILMRIPRRNFKFCTPDAWNGEEKYAGCPKWDVNFLLVGNEAGFATISRTDEHDCCALKSRRNFEVCRACTPRRWFDAKTR